MKEEEFPIENYFLNKNYSLNNKNAKIWPQYILDAELNNKKILEVLKNKKTIYTVSKNDSLNKNDKINQNNIIDNVKLI